MHISELSQLTSWIDKNIVSSQIPEKYQALQQKLQQSTNRNQQQQPFDIEKKALLDSLTNVPISQLSIDQLSFLRQLQIEPYIGLSGKKKVEDLMFVNVLDAATSAGELAKYHQAIISGIRKSDSIKVGLSGIIEPESPLKDSVLIRVAFTQDASISNVVDLKKWAATWFDIGRGIALINNAAPEDIKVVGAKRGSIIVELAVAYTIAKSVTNIIMLALKVTEKVVQIRKQAEEIRGLKLSNDKIAKELDGEADKAKAESADEIVRSVVASTQGDVKPDGEKVTALLKSVKSLLDFLEKGGEVDCVVPDDPTTNTEEEADLVKSIRDTSQEIRKIEHRIEQIEYRAQH